MKDRVKLLPPVETKGTEEVVDDVLEDLSEEGRNYIRDNLVRKAVKRSKERLDRPYPDIERELAELERDSNRGNVEEDEYYQRLDTILDEIADKYGEAAAYGEKSFGAWDHGVDTLVDLYGRRELSEVDEDSKTDEFPRAIRKVARMEEYRQGGFSRNDNPKYISNIKNGDIAQAIRDNVIREGEN